LKLRRNIPLSSLDLSLPHTAKGSNRRSAILVLVSLPRFQPMSLSRVRAPFSHPDWTFEIKWDGFRSLLYSDRDGVRLVSRNGNTFGMDAWWHVKERRCER